MRLPGWKSTLPLLLAAAVLSGCEGTTLSSSPTPQARPAGLGPDVQKERSAASRDLERYYLAVQNDLLTRGLLRTDGGGPDTPYDADDLVRNFENIAFFDEYSRNALSASPSGQRQSGALSRWSSPVRVGVEFGASVSPEQRTSDKAAVDAYVSRLSGLTGHSISTGRSNPNFHVLVAGEDDRTYLLDRVKTLIPSISPAELNVFADLPRSIYCLVIAVSSPRNPQTYTRAVALIRAEHPDLVRLSCVHEEIAQGLGLPNDSPYARPSIFNDDDEFALLTSHDEKLLAMLYDPRLKTGMSAEEAKPITRIIARELMGQSL
ncbi:DUF2927 domain-containing protein [Primorskyibacter sp. S87]|uniref:DUF2927 domain-containing protein n=1 Tax=Primorskyibacter sp. S87 TaxID=3415126 RepID=UPI003C7D6386